MKLKWAYSLAEFSNNHTFTRQTTSWKSRVKRLFKSTSFTLDDFEVLRSLADYEAKYKEKVVSGHPTRKLTN